MRERDGKIYVRLFNASQQTSRRKLNYDGAVTKVEQVQLNDKLVRDIPVTKDAGGQFHFDLELPGLGVGTVRITP
jgi:hypothetical protein